MQKEVAKLIGVSEDCITYWENGRSEPQIQFIPYIIKFLGYMPLEIDISTLGGKIKDYRVRNGLSHKKMGKLFGVDATTIAAWEKKSVKDINSLRSNRKSDLENVVRKISAIKESVIR